MEGFLTFLETWLHWKEKSLDRTIYVKLTYDPNVNENMNVKQTPDVRTICILVLHEWTFVVVGV